MSSVQPINGVKPNNYGSINTNEPIGSSKFSKEADLNSSNKDKNSNKLNTLNGVALPTILNVLSILMFLRFGFILGQMGILGTLFLLFLSYTIDLLTTLSISAIATNGTVKGGGTYYMISRSLGVEFGGSIGIIFYIGQVLNSSLNVAGLIEPLLYNFNSKNGEMWKLLPLDYWHQFAYCSIFLAVCTVVALIGSKTVSNCGTLLCILLILSTLSVPLSTFFVSPFEIPEINSYYSGPSWENFKSNLYPNFTKGAAGSQIDAVENFNDLFGIFFPATAGIFAGASMSGDLQNPSRAIPKGTLYGLIVTLVAYLLVIISMGCAIPRDLLYKDVQVLQTVNLSPVVILIGELSTSIFSVIVGIVGAAKVLQAIARDEIIPGIKIFGIGNSADDPIYGILFTWLLCQLFLFADINQIATLITMAFLMTFIVTNLACGLLKIGSAPNFRPSFKYFTVSTALMGTLLSGVAMFIVDGISASLIFIMLMFLILCIHYVSPPKQWGDVSQSLIYHQVRKYLLKLRQDNVKYWRPQVLLLVDNPRTSWKLINFCNHLKKGGLYILGHVLVSETFQDRVPDITRQRLAWTKLRDMCKLKAFVQISVAPTFPWGVRNVFLGSGLGGMRPNITILGFYDLSKYRSGKMPSGLRFESKDPAYGNQVNINIDRLPTDSCRVESKVSLSQWVHVIEDLSLLDSNIAVAKGFPRLHLPTDAEASLNEEEKKYIDLYPIQMSSRVLNEQNGKNILTTNFDTYTLILQLGAILNTVPSWKKTHKVRVVVFVEIENDIAEEKTRLESLLEVLRIKAEVLVLCLSSGVFDSYNYITKGEAPKDTRMTEKIDNALKDDEWWQMIREFRDSATPLNPRTNVSAIPPPTIQVNSKVLNKFESSSKRRYSTSAMNKLGVSFSIVTNKISNNDISLTLADSTSDEEDYSASDAESIVSSASSSHSTQVTATAPGLAQYGVYGTSNRPNPSVAHALRKPLLKNLKSTSSFKKLKGTTFSADTMPYSQVFDNAQGNEPSIISMQGIEPGSSSGVNMTTLIQQADAHANPDNTTSYDNLNFSFNELTAKSQFLILNDLMLKTSKDSALLFSTLPIPEIGLHNDEGDCLDYVTNLDIWCDGLPPIMLINARTMTVTTNL
ncbi:hypothetical protein CANARDRAFT_228981 [[Candida] arabinofermentans NRRL YB-2248]|uniref:Amino acid permease/ SLC12A domain-containing protein n=1 Tax=[Candida] arabinofermentans NRRL YB-2248 TaxID=983967 RepID=A0A1E4T902_9ASCO|nr:hypothetical protein CANARDRAFT_228981 [[Candida] arabinofermentans NRRL YB-2248]